MTIKSEAPAPTANGNGRNRHHAQAGSATHNVTITIPAPLKPAGRYWCAWRQDWSKPNAKGERRPTKVPYATPSARAKSNDAATWITLDAAQRIAATPSFIRGAVDGLCGVAVFLGAETLPDAVLCGVDLDTCLAPVTYAPTQWAQAVIDTVQSYAEISPSGTGIKQFFLLTPSDTDRVLQVTGVLGRQWKQAGSDHPPGIELYLGGRYFTMTGSHWPGSPADICIVQSDAVLQVVREIAPSLKPDAANAKPRATPRAKTSGAASGTNVDQEGDRDAADSAMSKITAWAALNPKVARLLAGDLSDLSRDQSASNVAFCLAGHCKDAGIPEDEAKALVGAYAPEDLSKYASGRDWERVWARARAGATPSSDDARDPREPLLINGADLTETAAAVTALLTKSSRLYHRDGPVTVVRDPQRETWAAHPLTANGVVRETHQVARPFKTAADGGAKFITLPERVALMALDDRHAWCALRPLDGFASTPLLQDDGTIRTAEGYDATSRLFCTAAPEVAVPRKPTRAEAEAALLSMRMFFRTFAFEDAEKVDCDGVAIVAEDRPPGQDESAALHALLTAVCRPHLHLAPALVVTAPSLSGAGAGKGLLVRVICAVAFGQKPVATTAGHNAEELDKRIATALMAAHQVLFLDNLNNRALKSDTLASAITERPSEVRIMGTSKNARIAAASFIAITGNGLTVSEDMARRVLHVTLDPGVEDPEARKFKTDILADAFAKRADLLSAALTVWRWGRQSDAVNAGRPIGSFEQWARWVRDPLVTLGCADPAERIAATKLRDPRRAEAADLFAKWNEHHGHRAVAVSELHQEVREIADPGNRGRQYLAIRIRSLVGTRAAGFVLLHLPKTGAWGADKFALKETRDPQGIGVIGGMEKAQAQ